MYIHASKIYTLIGSAMQPAIFVHTEYADVSAYMDTHECVYMYVYACMYTHTHHLLASNVTLRRGAIPLSRSCHVVLVVSFARAWVNELTSLRVTKRRL